MTFKNHFLFEFLKLFSKRFGTILLLFLAASLYLIQVGFHRHDNILEQKQKFQDTQPVDLSHVVSWAQYGAYGHLIVFIPSPFMAFFNGGPVPNFMTVHLDASERLKIYRAVKGRETFGLSSSGLKDFSGLILFIASLMVLGYGFEGFYNHQWLMSMAGLAGGRNRYFIYMAASRTIILFLFCLTLAVMSMVLSRVNSAGINTWDILLYFFEIFRLLAVFLGLGFISGLIIRRFVGVVFLAASYFAMVVVFPFLLTHLTENRASSITSRYQTNARQQDILHDFEHNSKEKAGKLTESKRKTEIGKEIYSDFWNGTYDSMKKEDEDTLDQVESRVSFYQTLAALSPATFFISVSNEMSGKGFLMMVAFNKHGQEMKKKFVLYITSNQILTKKKLSEVEPFIKGDETIFQGSTGLPGNYFAGFLMTLIWWFGLLGASWYLYRRLFFLETGEEKEFDTAFKKRVATIIFTLDERVYPRLLIKLRRNQIPFIPVPHPNSVPGNMKVKRLFKLFGLRVPEGLKEEADYYTHEEKLTTHKKGILILEILRAAAEKTDGELILVFKNFIAGMPKDLQSRYKDFVTDFKKSKTLVYFTDTIDYYSEKGDVVKDI
ncbi:MAG: hypothetical protein GY940_46960 [bacterium]|nr:hypothetical protein [bacterium]